MQYKINIYNYWYFLKPTKYGLRKKLLQWIVMDEQPFTTIESQEFNNLITYLWPKADIPTAITIRRDLTFNFDKMKEIISQELRVSNLIIFIYNFYKNFIKYYYSDALPP